MIIWSAVQIGVYFQPQNWDDDPNGEHISQGG
jgi:hypothetical protein